VNRDVPRVIVTVLGAVPELRRMRPGIVDALPGFDIGRLDRLESYALALAHAQAEYLKAPATNPGPTELAREVRRWRDELLGVVQALAARGVIPKPSAGLVERRRAYGPLAVAVLALAEHLREHSAAIAGKTVLERSELDQATSAAQRLLGAMALPRRKPEKKAVAEERDRAFTLLIRAYADVRRAVRYLRWRERDADGVAPSLYRRGERQRSRPGLTGTTGSASTERSAEGGRGAQKKNTRQATRPWADRQDVHLGAMGRSDSKEPRDRNLPMANTQDSTQDNDSSPSSFRDAYESALAEIEAVPDSELVHISIDVTSAAVTVLGALPEIRALRGEIAENLTKFDLARFDRLESYTRALVHAQALYRSATTPKGSVTELAAELAATRDLLFSDASALARRGLIDPERLKEFKTSSGYREIAIDVLGLAALLREHWGRIEGKTAVTLADLDQAASSVEQMLVALGLREQAPSAVGEVVKNRQRAFTLFAGTYEDARRAVGYLRPSEVDAIAPSLYAGRAAKRKNPDETDPTPETAPLPSGGSGAASPSAAGSAPKVGLPVTSPFQD
jgi:hypothetical protein